MARSFHVHHGDCFEVLKEYPDNTFDAVVTDPPYGIRFMGKAFDDLGDAPAQQAWHEGWLRECYRVLKPGGVVKAFGGTRTFHRLAAAMGSAGFVDMDIAAWIYSSGFPKSLNVRKALEKAGCPDAALWDGYGTALKPAWEPFLCGKKP